MITVHCFDENTDLLFTQIRTDFPQVHEVIYYKEVEFIVIEMKNTGENEARAVLRPLGTINSRPE